MDVSDQKCTSLATNPDITGIGVRVSIYVQALISIILPLVSETIDEEANNRNRNILLSSSALVATAFLQASSSDGLSLLDGIVVTYLTSLIGLGPGADLICMIFGDFTLKLTYALHSALVISFGLILWAHVDTFGSTPQCNSTVQFIFFGHSFDATTTAMKILSITFYANAAFCILLVAFLFIIASLFAKSPAALYSEFQKHIQDKSYSPRLILTCFTLGSWAYIVATTEQIIARNGIAGLTLTWTYGQMLSMFLLVTPISDLIFTTRRYIRSSMERRERDRDAESHGAGASAFIKLPTTA